MFDSFIPGYLFLNVLLVVAFLSAVLVFVIHFVTLRISVPKIVKNDRFYVAFFLVLIALQALLLVHVYSPTYDEMLHIQYGSYVLQHAALPEFVLDDNPPLRSFLALPFLMLGRPIVYDVGEPPPSFPLDLYFARVMVVALLVWLAYAVFICARKFLGAAESKLALLLCVFFPSLVAFGALSTTDLLVTLMMLLTFHFFTCYVKEPGWKYAFLTSVAFTGALLSKFTAAILIPVMIFGLVWTRPVKLKVMLSHLVVSCALVLFLTCAGFFFHGLFHPLGSFEFRSSLLSSLAENPMTSDLPVPLPERFMLHFDYAKWHAETYHTIAFAYLRGVRSIVGFPQYYVYASLIKFPLAILLLLVLALASLLRVQKPGDWIYFLMISVVVLTYVLFTVSSRINLGIRHILFVIPFICLISARAASIERLKYVIVAAVAFLIVSCVLAYPYYLGYYNEVVGVKNGYRHLADSDTDWGQGEKFAEWYVASRDNMVYVNPGCSPVAGTVLVSVNNYVGLFKSREQCYSWLYNYDRIDVIAGSWLLFEVENADYEERALNTSGIV